MALPPLVVGHAHGYCQAQGTWSLSVGDRTCSCVQHRVLPSAGGSLGKSGQAKVDKNKK